MLKFSKRPKLPEEFLLTTGELEALSPTPARPPEPPPSKAKNLAPVFARRAHDSDHDMTRAYRRDESRTGVGGAQAPHSMSPMSMPADASASHGRLVVRSHSTLVRALVLMASGASVGVLIAMVLQARSAAQAPASQVAEPTYVVPGRVVQTSPDALVAPQAQAPLVVPTTAAQPVAVGAPVAPQAAPPAAHAPPSGSGLVLAPLSVVPPKDPREASAPPKQGAAPAPKGGPPAAQPPPKGAAPAAKVQVTTLKPTVTKQTPAPSAPRKEKDEDILKQAQQTTTNTL